MLDALDPPPFDSLKPGKVGTKPRNLDQKLFEKAEEGATHMVVPDPQHHIYMNIPFEIACDTGKRNSFICNLLWDWYHKDFPPDEVSVYDLSRPFAQARLN